MTRFKNKTKDRALLLAAIDSELYTIYSKIRDNTRAIRRLADEQRGLKELRHVLQSAKSHFIKEKKEAEK